MRPKQATKSARIQAALATASLKLLAATLRYRVGDTNEKLAPLKDHPFIFAIWHNRLALSLPLYRRLITKQFPSHRLAALVSASRDGAMLSEILRRFDVQPVRGSSSRRGAQALRELARSAAEGCDLAITPDGPRGPCYRIQDGVIAAAQLSGLPILPASYNLSSKITLKSWDRFQVPLPFSLCEVRTGTPIYVPRDADDAQRSTLKQALQREMDSITSD